MIHMKLSSYLGKRRSKEERENLVKVICMKSELIIESGS